MAVKKPAPAIHERIDRLRGQIASAAVLSGRSGDAVRVVAVTKGRDESEIRAAIDAGLTALGENFLQEASPKILALWDAPVEWHFLGHLQRNKLRAVCEKFQWVHGVDRSALAPGLHDFHTQAARLPTLLLEVRLAGGDGRYGLLPEEVEPVLEGGFLPLGIPVDGLMTMAPPATDPEDVRPVFRTLRQLAARVEARRYPGVTMRHLSMGMTDDFQVAIQEGATIVRIGRGIFGPRPSRQQRPAAGTPPI